LVVPLAGVAVSQLPPPDTAAATVYASGPGVPLTVIVCAGGAVFAPCTCANVSDAGAAEIVPGSTCSVTATFTGLPDAVGDAIVTVPLYVPAGRLEPLTFTDTVPGVASVAVPFEGVAESQPVPCAVVTVVVNAISVLLVAIRSVCAAGGVAPSGWVNESVVGVTVIAAAVTVNVTGMVTGLFCTPAVVAVKVIVVE
jgi:hypothetical protein